MTRRLLLSTALLLATWFVAEPAFAYVLPSDFIMRMLADKRRRMGIRDLTIHLTTEISGAELPIDERIYLKNPERSRRIRQDEETTSVTVQREELSARGPENAIARLKGTPPELLPMLLMPRGKSLDEMELRLLETLKSFAIDSSVVALGRFDERVAYIIGAKLTEKNKPQLWVDKETFLPIRFILPNKGGGTKEVRWLEFGSSATGDWFPRVVETYVNDKRVEHSEVAEIELNQKVPETLFDIPK